MNAVWLALEPLEAIEAAMPDPDAWLVAAERERARRISAASRRRQFLAGHWRARALAANVVGGDAAGWQWQEWADGRRLCRDGEVLHVSLAHSGDHVAVALAQRPVGIDVEVPRRRRDLAALARAVGSPHDVAAFEALPAEQRDAAFLRLWTLKEAQGKREGHGLLPARARQWSLHPAPPAQSEAVSWSGAWGSLAVCAAPGIVPRPERPVQGRQEFWSCLQFSP